MGSNQGPENVSIRIVSEIAEAKGIPPTKLTPLAEVIDPDAIEKIFSGNSKADRRLQFNYEGFSVVIEGHGEITLEEL